MLRPRERRRPRMPNQLSVMVEQRIVAFALGHPGFGPRRVAARLARPEWGGLVVSPNGVYKTLVRHGLNTRAKRLALVAGYRAPLRRRASPRPNHTSTATIQASWSASTASSSAACTAPRPGLADHRDRHPQQLRLGRPCRLPTRGSNLQTDLRARAAGRRRAPSRGLAARARALRQRQRVRPPGLRLPTAGRRRAHPDPLRRRRPTATSNGCTAPPRRMLAARLRALPASPLQRPTPRPRPLPPRRQPRPRTPRTHHQRPTPRRPRLRCPQDGAEMSRTCRHNSES